MMNSVTVPLEEEKEKKLNYSSLPADTSSSTSPAVTNIVHTNNNDGVREGVKRAIDISSESSTLSTSSSLSANDYKEAIDQSFGFFDDIPSHQWKIFKEIVAKYKKFEDPKDPLELTIHPKWKNPIQAFYQANYEPNFSCPFERRVGKNGDGGKWVCDPHRIIRLAEERNQKKADDELCLVYSIGSNGGFSFEKDFQESFGGNGKLCEVHIFDMGPYESKMPKGLNMHYHEWGIETGAKGGSMKGENKKQIGKKYKSLAETVKLLGHENRSAIDIFKIDCEGCEWDTFEEWYGPNIPMLQQILVETHGVPLDKALPFFDGIMGNGYVMFHKEPNIQFAFGEAIEFCFLKLEKAFFPATGY
jgi:hypothetical protein